jgi:pimeloyl-ACP methyl ester carboxylesterase
MKRLVYGCLLLTLGTVSVAPAFAQDTSARPDSNLAELKQLNTWVTFLRTRNAKDYAITTPNGIDEAKFVTIGGIQQWISIRGEDRNNPVILFLHGGPGDVTSLWAYAGFRTWLRQFTVVQWDQRGAGRTLGKNGTSIGPTMTVDRMVKDGIELSELLRATLKQPKIILVGHSWGSVLGVYMAKARPDLFYAYVGTGQVAAGPATNNAATYRELLQEAERRGDRVAVRELQQAGPPPSGGRVQHKWANLYEHADMFLNSTFGAALFAPGYSIKDINDWFDGQGFSGEHLIPQFDAADAALGGTFQLPVFVFQGAEDFTTSTSLARQWVGGINAPRKAFVPIEGGGHFAVFTQTDVFLKELVDRVLPLVQRPPTPRTRR